MLLVGSPLTGSNNSIEFSIVVVAIRFRVYHVCTLQRNEKKRVVSLNDDVSEQAT
jgi:hypothetical protein